MEKRRTIQDIYQSFEVEKVDQVQLRVDSAYQKGMEEGRKIGETVGFEKGENTALESHQDFVKSLLISINDEIPSIQESVNLWKEQFIPMVTHVAHAICKKIMPIWFEKHGINEVESLITSMSDTLLDDVAFTIKVCPQNKEHVEDNIINNINYPKELVTIEEDRSLDPMQFILKWKGGGANWNACYILEKMDDLLVTITSSLPTGESKNKEEDTPLINSNSENEKTLETSLTKNSTITEENETVENEPNEIETITEEKDDEI